ncbi:unnamed protein product [Ectocarpus fasciculatus]
MTRKMLSVPPRPRAKERVRTRLVLPVGVTNVYCVRNHYVFEAQGRVLLATGGSQVYMSAVYGWGIGWAADRLVTKKFCDLWFVPVLGGASAAVSIIAIADGTTVKNAARVSSVFFS